MVFKFFSRTSLVHDTVATNVWQDQLDYGLVVLRNVEIEFKLNGEFHTSCSVTAGEKKDRSVQ